MISEKANEAWDGRLGNEINVNKFITNTLEELTPGIAFIATFANVVILNSDHGLILVDCGAELMASQIFSLCRKYSTKPVLMIIYTHGHIDHIGGVLLFDKEAEKNGWAKPLVVAHENLAKRFDRYKLTAGIIS
jgi:glyoxylase-like metal-dependent hydrolase (beta-lactamase superfamily II)